MNPSRNTKPPATTRQATATSAIIGVVEMTLRFEIFPDDLDATVEDLRDRLWGLRDFRVLDPAGYYLRITDRAR